MGTSSTATPIDVGPVEVVLEAEIVPSSLPRFEARAVSARVGVSIKTDDHRLPPKLRAMDLSLDRHISVHLGRGSECTKRELENTAPADAMRACGRDLLGAGRAEAIVAYPGQPRFRSRGRVLVFAGSPSRGADRLLIHSFFPRPIRATAVSAARISSAPGPRFGVRLAVKTPKIAGGNGRLVAIRLRLGGRSDTGPSGPLVTATCPTRRLAILTRLTFARPLGDLRGARVLGCGERAEP